MGVKSNDKLANGTHGNPQESFEQDEFAINNGSVWNNVDIKPKDNNDKSQNETTINQGVSVKLTKREELLNTAISKEVKEIVNQLYRPGAIIGDGGTADALRMEIKFGIKINDKTHLQKAQERINQINKILNKYPTHPDRDLLITLRDDLIDAVNKYNREVK